MIARNNFSEFEVYDRPDLRRFLISKMRVLFALMVRDALGRYGHANFGFFWIIGEPLLFSCAIMLLWSFAHLGHSGSVEVVPFALTGYSFITMWRHITARSIGAIRQFNNLRYHRQVKLIDTLLAVALIETIGCFSAFIIAYLPLWVLGICPTMSDPLVLVSGFALAALFSLGFGLMLAGLSQANDLIHHFVPAVMYVTIPLTGIFTMQSWLPEKISRLMLWSPLVNAIEMFRGGLFSAEVKPMYSIPYLIGATIFSLFAGCVIFGYFQNHDH